jgi:hypothetical protein
MWDRNTLNVSFHKKIHNRDGSTIDYITVELKLMRELTREVKQSIKEGRDSQLLIPMAELKAKWKKNGKEDFTISVKTPKGTEEKATLKGTTGMACLRGSARYEWTVVSSCQ